MKNTHTPWGMSQHAQELIPGIIAYDTASHGGYYVAKELMSRIPAGLRDTWAGYQWFEEDCDWAIVALCFPEAFSAKHCWHAMSTMLDHRQKEHAQAYLQTPASLPFREKVEEFKREHAKSLVLGSSASHEQGTQAFLHSVDGLTKATAIFARGVLWDIRWPAPLESVQALAKEFSLTAAPAA